MNKKILVSLSVIAAVAAIAIGGTVAYFSDTETSTGNTFTAGTIDISIDGQNPWTNKFTMADMKPCYTDYINFVVRNDLSDPNPVNVWKKLYEIVETTGTVSEPECTEEGGTWNVTCTGNTERNNLSSVIWYDLYVEVYDGSNNLLFWQTIYEDADMKSIAEIFGVMNEVEKGVYLGMIPAGGYMKVTQSYHMAPNAGNEYQGDTMTFDIAVYAEQLHGEAVLENKRGPEPWHLVLGDNIQGTLTYEVKHPTFDFAFTGKAPMVNHGYVLAAGMKNVGGGNFDVDTKLGTGATDGNGNITITGDIELNKNMKDVKVWLVPVENWSDSTEMVWAGWPGIVPNFLWETGLIWYEDTDI